MPETTFRLTIPEDYAPTFREALLGECFRPVQNLIASDEAEELQAGDARTHEVLMDDLQSGLRIVSNAIDLLAQFPAELDGDVKLTTDGAELATLASVLEMHAQLACRTHALNAVSIGPLTAKEMPLIDGALDEVRWAAEQAAAVNAAWEKASA